jgi:hypothetical protein
VQIGEFITRLTEEMPSHHRIFPPLSNNELKEWRATWIGHPLPEDLMESLRHSNGIQFWVHAGSPEGYFRLFPLREIDSARRIMWLGYGDSTDTDEVPYLDWLAISEHQDGGEYIVLDTDRQRYYLMDTILSDLSNPIGHNIPELLEFIWKDWVKAVDNRLEARIVESTKPSNSGVQRSARVGVHRVRVLRRAPADRTAALGRERLTKWAASSSHDEATVRVVRQIWVAS